MSTRIHLAAPRRVAAPTPKDVAEAMAACWFRRRGDKSQISRQELAALLQGAAEIALQHCTRQA